ncbi:hypothetical protein GGQ04_002659 [Salinibacter ruber]|nr:hypothetical protein [Salinibacter ruber]
MLLDEYTRSQFSIESLKEFVNSGHRTYTPNAQLRAVTGIENSDEEVGPQTLERAKDILEEYFVVAGITERFDAAVLLMKDRLDWPWPPFYVRSRVGSAGRKTPIPGGLRRQIRAQNQWDVRLYEYVRDRLNQEIENKGEVFQRRLRRFKKMNQLFGTLTRPFLQGFRSVRDWGKERGLVSLS